MPSTKCVPPHRLSSDRLRESPPVRPLCLQPSNSAPHESQYRGCPRARRISARRASRSGTPANADAFSQALQRTSDRDKSSRDFDAPEHGVVGRDQKIAAQSEFESPSEGDTPYSRDRRHGQNLKSAV